MRVREFLTTKSFVALLSFAVFAVAASLTPSPWRDGPLLELVPQAPPGFRDPAPLIQWPAADDVRAEGFAIELDLSHATPETSSPPSQTKAPRPQHDESEAASSSPAETAVEVGAPAPAAREEKPVADPRDVALLASLRQLREQLPQKTNHLEIPCRRAREYPDGSPMLETQKELTNGDCKRKSLDNFYHSLRQRARKEPGLTRWSQYGDSLVVGDTLTGELRRLFQAQFGDGGHGFVFIGQPLRAFGFENIRVGATDDWNVRTIVRHAPEGGDLFGLGGAEFRASRASNLLLQSPRNDELGKDLEFFHVFYFAPSGVTSGSFRFMLDGETRTETFETTPGSSGVYTIRVPRGEHRVRFSDFSPHLRFYGVVSETSGPGVVIDNIGQVSAREEHLLKINAEQWRDQLALRDPNLVAFFYGVNAASSSGSRIEERDNYADNYREVIRRATTGAPKRDCLVLSLLTRGTREGGKISPTGAVAVLNREQRRAALSSGCAFFDTTAMMGGPNATRRWAESRPTLLGADLAHPTPAGYREIARRLYADLIDGFIDYLERQIQAGGTRP